jgi:CubicO group peptidase (beta-lactamase class C family)
MRERLVCIGVVLILSLTNCAKPFEDYIERKIQRVEHGLISDYGDPPWKRMDLEDRMAYYSVPGVSIAVINDFQIEWSRGYGVLEAGKSEPVTSTTLFQVASPGKVVVAVAALHFVEEGTLTLDGDVNQSLLTWSIPDNQFMEKEKVTSRLLHLKN